MLKIFKSFHKNETEEEGPSVITVFLAELVGTAILMFAGCMGTCVQMVDSEIIHNWPSLTFGLTVMTAIQITGHVSGAHLNPQITIGAVVLGKLELILAPVYIIAQTIGGFIGFAAIWALTPADYQNGFCVSHMSDKINAYQGVIVEVIITAIFLMMYGAVCDAKNIKNSDSLCLRFGLFIALMGMVAGPYSGPSMNTLRSVIPAIFSNDWDNHWIYWVGPTIGAIIGSALYRFVFESKPPVQ